MFSNHHILPFDVRCFPTVLIREKKFPCLALSALFACIELTLKTFYLEKHYESLFKI